MIVAVERHTAAIAQEEAMQTSPISTEISARVHFDELARQAEQYRVARRVLENTSKDPQDQVLPARPVIWIRWLTAMLSAARV
jgi:hypothetical protein